MSNDGAAPRAAVPISSARAEASRRNGAKSRGPKSVAGKTRSAQNALRHGLRAQKYVVLPDEDAVEFAALEAALLDELAPVGSLQTVLARRIAVAAWRLARADCIEVELFEQRRWDNGGVGIALIRDGNGTRSFETLMRYRSAAMAEFMRALRTLKALQAGAAAEELPVAAPAPVRAQPARSAARPPDAHLPGPNEPERLPDSRAERRPGPQLEYVLPDSTAPGHTLHEPAAPWLSNHHAAGPRHVADDLGAKRPNEPEAAQNRSERGMMPAPFGQTIVEPALRAAVSPEAPEPGTGHGR